MVHSTGSAAAYTQAQGGPVFATGASRWDDAWNRISAHGYVVAWIVLGVSLLATISCSYLTYRQLDSRASARFDSLVAESRHHLSDRIESYAHAIRSGAFLFETLKKEPSRAEWTAFVEHLAIRTNYPGMQGVGYAQMIAPGDVATFVNRVRSDGFPDFRIRPLGNRSVYSSVTYLAPLDQRTRQNFGYDMYSEQTRREAMDRARDTGKMAVSGRVSLLHSNPGKSRSGFLAYLPVYNGKGVPSSLVERRELLRGYVFGLFSIDELVSGLAGDSAPLIRLRLFDGPLSNDLSPLFDTQPAEPVPAQAREAIEGLDVGGRQWVGQFLSTSKFDILVGSYIPLVIGTLGISADLFLFFLIIGFLKQRSEIKERADIHAEELVETRNILRQTALHTEVGFVRIELEQRRVQIDSNAGGILGMHGVIDQEEFLAEVHPSDRSAVQALIESTTENPDPQSVRFRMTRPDRSCSTVSANRVTDAQSSQGDLLVLMVKDLSRESEESEASKIMKKALSSIRDGLMITDHRHVITDINEAVCKISGYAREELIGKTPRIFHSGKQAPEFYQEFWEHIRKTGYWEGRLWNRCRDGGLFAAHERISAIHNPEGDITHYVAVFTDVTESIEQQHRLDNIALTDPLTGLGNRSFVHDRLRDAKAQASLTGATIAVCYVDLDNFRLVNERLGHAAGDELLILIASRLKTLVRSEDALARIGGDEFALVLNNRRDYRSCKQYAEKILSGLRGSYTLSSENTVYVSASMGMSVYPGDDADSDSLMRHADQAMYEAKDSGRDHIVTFDVDKSSAEVIKRRQVQRIDYAIRDQEFVLHYQPQVNMRTGKVIGAEALVRWQHPEDGLIYPDQFLPMVAGTEQAVAIDKWVIAEALRQTARFQAAGLHLSVSVNIDGAFLQRVDFVDYLCAQIAANPGVEPAMLEIEILESTALTDLNNVTKVIRTCQEMGVTVALDDFGTGYSSLTYLKQLPCDTLKIDKSFIIDMTEEPESKSLVEGIVGLARALGRRIVAEGVESETHGRMLLGMGCECGQGYGIQRPVPADELVVWIRAYTQPHSWLNFANNVHWIDRSTHKIVSS